MHINSSTRQWTEIDPETQSIFSAKCILNQHFNDIIIVLMKCNMDIKYIGSGEATKALIFYITDYVTKTHFLPTLVWGALQFAIKQTIRSSSMTTSPWCRPGQSLFMKLVNTMVARQEVSHQQVMSHLMGGGDTYTSHSFKLLRWV